MRRRNPASHSSKDVELIAAAAGHRTSASSLRTVVVAARKGGTGKTTLAVHLALAAHLRGGAAILADADPQRSATQAMRARTGSGPRCLDTSGLSLAEIRSQAERLRASLLVIDTPGGGGSTLPEALRLADLVLLIARPTFIDIAAAVRTYAEARTIGVQSLIVLNQALPMRSGQEHPTVQKAIQALRANGLPVSAAVVRSRVAFQTSMAQGRSVEELGATAAAEEVAALWAAAEAKLADGCDGKAAIAGAANIGHRKANSHASSVQSIGSR
jgi:chromosome partitioning protein